VDLRVVTYPHPALLKKTESIATVDASIRERAAAMLDLMHSSKGVGLAAPQVAWSVRLLVLNPGEDRNGDEVLVNPRIVRKRGKVLGEEGCLSFPGIFVQVERAKEIELEFADLDGKIRVETRQDFVARIIQHEMDHLDNVLLLHRMSPADRVKWKPDLEALAGRR
jgi:peptide deformylase